MEEFEERGFLGKLLDFLVVLSVIIVTIFLLLDLLGLSGLLDMTAVELHEIYIPISIAILIVFILDLIRLWRHSTTVGEFFKNGWLDIVATIPFELIAWFLMSVSPETVSAFGLLKWARAAKISRAARIVRLGRISQVTRQFKLINKMSKDKDKKDDDFPKL